MLFSTSLAILTNLVLMALQPLHNVYRFNAMLWYQTTTLQLSNWLSPNNLLRFIFFIAISLDVSIDLDNHQPTTTSPIYNTCQRLSSLFMFYIKINIKCIHRIFLSFSKFEVLELRQQPTPYEPSLKTTFLESL